MRFFFFFKCSFHLCSVLNFFRFVCSFQWTFLFFLHFQTFSPFLLTLSTIRSSFVDRWNLILWKNKKLHEWLKISNEMKKKCAIKSKIIFLTNSIVCEWNEGIHFVSSKKKMLAVWKQNLVLQKSRFFFTFVRFYSELHFDRRTK